MWLASWDNIESGGTFLITKEVTRMNIPLGVPYLLKPIYKCAYSWIIIPSLCICNTPPPHPTGKHRPGKHVSQFSGRLFHFSNLWGPQFFVFSCDIPKRNQCAWPASEPDALMWNRWLMSQSFFLIHRAMEAKKKRKKRQHWGVAEGQWAEQKEQQIGVLRVRKKAEKIKENPVI